jgi:hypothetical protein
MKIIIGQSYDSVTFLVKNDDGTEKRFYFNQEDTFEDMVKFFNELGIDSEFEEW